MRTAFKFILFFLICGLVFISFMFIRSNDVNADKKHGKEFGKWVVSCDELSSNSSVEANIKDSDKSSKNDTKKGSSKSNIAESNKICVLRSAIITEADKNGKSDVLSVYRFAYLSSNKSKDKKLNLIVTVPLGVNLQYGISFNDKEGVISSTTYSYCNNLGCHMVREINDEELKRMVGDNDVSMSFFAQDLSPVTLPLPGEKLKEGLQFIKK